MTDFSKTKEAVQQDAAQRRRNMLLRDPINVMATALGRYADRLGMANYQALQRLQEDSRTLLNAISSQEWATFDKTMTTLAASCHNDPLRRTANYFGIYLLALCEIDEDADVDNTMTALANWCQSERPNFYTRLAGALWHAPTVRTEHQQWIIDTLSRGYDITKLPKALFARRLTSIRLSPIDLLPYTNDTVTRNFLLQMMSYEPPENTGFLF